MAVASIELSILLCTNVATMCVQTAEGRASVRRAVLAESFLVQKGGNEQTSKSVRSRDYNVNTFIVSEYSS